MTANTQVRQASDADQLRLITAAPNLGGLRYFPGTKARGVLHFTGNIIADETVTIGSNVFQYKALTTDSTRTCSLANETGRSLLTASGAMTWAAGDLLRIENEIVKIVALIAGALTTQAEVARARCGTSAASHTTAAIFQASAVHATNIPVGVNATLTPAVAVPALVAEINNALSGGNRVTAKASTIFDPGSTYADSARTNKVNAIAGPAADCVIIESALKEAAVLATTETLTNAAWVQGATMLYGVAQAAKRRAIVPFRAVTAAEVTAGKIVIPLDFNPSFFNVLFKVTATGAPKAWGGLRTVAATTTGYALTLANNASVDFAATDDVGVSIEE